MIIGLTGKNAAGKGELAKHLESLGYKYYSLSDALRDEATKRGLDHTRDVLIKLGTELRKEFGNTVLAGRINEKIAADKANGTTHFAIDSIRNPGEIEELRENEDFILVGVHTDPGIRFERLLKRGRTGDAKTLEEFEAHEAKENNNESAGQQLDKCLEMVDVVISSNGTVEEANQALDKYLEVLAKQSELMGS